jgi:virulence factor Mce-like protein
VNKQAPNLPRVLTMVTFALSCFGLLLFLWLSFGGPIPLKPTGYRVAVAFPEAPTLGIEADVRVAGVSVGKVRKKELAAKGNRTDVEIELDSRFAPLAKDAKAMLRQKTLLGETYVELTPGTSKEKIAEGGRLPDGQVAPTVELDEIFDALDEDTKVGFRTWQQELGKGIQGRGHDLNDAFGTLPGFAKDGADVLEVLDAQGGALSRLVKNTGVVFGAISENESQLRNLITGSSRLFDATSRQKEALAESIRIFPTFLDESEVTLARLKTFAQDTDPLIQDLQPVARDLGPTLRDARALAPDLRAFYQKLDPLISASKAGLPATTEILQGAKPLLGEIAPFLAEALPIFRFFEHNQLQVAEFLSNGSYALAATAQHKAGTGHYLRQIGPTGAETVAMYPNRLATNRGNGYPATGSGFFSEKGGKFLVQGSFDCRNAGGEKPPTDNGPQDRSPGCWEAPPQTIEGKLQGRFPHVERYDLDKPLAPQP